MNGHVHRLRSEDEDYREITPQLDGEEFMFSFMPPGAVVSVIDWASQHLGRIAAGFAP